MKKSYLFLLFLPLATLPSCKSATMVGLNVSFDETIKFNSGDEITRSYFDVSVVYSDGSINKIEDFKINNANTYLVTYNDTSSDTLEVTLSYENLTQNVSVNLLKPTSSNYLGYQYVEATIDEIAHFEVYAYNKDEVTELIVPGLYVEEKYGEQTKSAPVTKLYVQNDTGAFEGFTSITSAILPNTITEISKNAFKGCTSLQSIQLPSNLKKINEYAFESCTSLEEITLGDYVTTINKGAFTGCEKLSSFTFGKNIDFIGVDAFKGAGSELWGTYYLTVTFPDDCKLRQIDSSAFESARIESIEFPANFKSLGYSAFKESKIKKVKFKDTNNWRRVVGTENVNIDVSNEETNATNLLNSSDTGENWGKTGICKKTD